MKSGSHVRSICIGLAIYGVLSLGSLFVRSPFRAAVEEACELGSWQPEQVTFLRGSYGYRFLYSVAEAELRVQADGRTFPVRIEIRNLPLAGWSVRRFERVERPASLALVSESTVPSAASL